MSYICYTWHSIHIHLAFSKPDIIKIDNIDFIHLFFKHLSMRLFTIFP